jgi:hypothetical protein
VCFIHFPNCLIRVICDLVGDFHRLPPGLRGGLAVVAHDHLRRPNSGRLDCSRSALQWRKYRGRPRQRARLHGQLVRPHAHFLVERRFARWTLGILFIMTFTFASSSMAMALIFNCFLIIFVFHF